MIFDQTSRYFTLSMSPGTTQIWNADGSSHDVHYVRRRTISSMSASSTTVPYTVKAGDRPDTIAYRCLGDSTVFWQICDANNVLRPNDLTDSKKVGQKIKIRLPGW